MRFMEMEDAGQLEWKEVITPSGSLFTLNLREIWEYKDLVLLWVKRDLSAIYKQTILGPIWFFLQPVLTTATYSIIFSRFAKFANVNMPVVLFYLSGIILWGYFSECITKTASFLKDNTSIFSKVYFPRLVIPLSIIITNLIKFAIQFGLFLLVYLYYLLFRDQGIQLTPWVLIVPLIILVVALLGLGGGIIIASLTIRYKDLSHLIIFGIQLMMFLSPVLIPLNSAMGEQYRWILLANPMSGLIEAFRFAFTGSGYFSWSILSYDLACMLLLLFIGILSFNASEKTFVDTI